MTLLGRKSGNSLFNEIMESIKSGQTDSREASCLESLG